MKRRDWNASVNRSLPRVRRVVAAAGLALASASCAQSGSGYAQDAPATPPGVAAADEPMSGIGCAKSEVVVFACVLQGSKDHVALCAGQGAASQVLYFVRSGSAPQIYPSDRRGAGQFMTTHVFSTGATGIRTHSFEQPDRRHVFYSVSGTGIEEQGLFTLPPRGSKPQREEKCVLGTQQDPGWELAESWKPDALIETHGLPHL